MSFILTSIEANVGSITLNNPAKRNALNAAMLADFNATLEAFRQASVRAVVLRAPEGAPVWSSGHDINELPLAHEDPLGYEDPVERTLRRIKAFPAPVIAMVHGPVYGAACDLALSCDMVFGDATAAFAITPANLGLPYNVTGILQVMMRVPLNVAKEMFFTAALIDAERAEKWGILNRLLPAAELERFTFDLARVIASKAPLAVAVMKEQFRILVNSHPVSPETWERIQEFRHRVYESKDYLEGIRAFQEKRKPIFTGE